MNYEHESDDSLRIQAFRETQAVSLKGPAGDNSGSADQLMLKRRQFIDDIVAVCRKHDAAIDIECPAFVGPDDTMGPAWVASLIQVDSALHEGE